MTGLLVTARQLEVLQAAGQGRLARDSFADLFSAWRVDGGRACTLSAWCLVDRGLITVATEPLGDGRVLALITEAGRAVLDELASREPHPITPRTTS